MTAAGRDYLQCCDELGRDCFELCADNPPPMPHRGKYPDPRYGAYWSVADAADLLGVATTTLYTWRQKGIGPPCVKVKRGPRRTVYRYSPTALQTWIDEHRDWLAAHKANEV